MIRFLRTFQGGLPWHTNEQSIDFMRNPNGLWIQDHVEDYFHRYNIGKNLGLLISRQSTHRVSSFLLAYILWEEKEKELATFTMEFILC